MTFIGEAIIGEFISKVSDSIVDISKAKIKEAVKDRKNKYQGRESQIYNIMVDVLNKITYDKYKNDQDKIYDVAEKILKGFKSGIDNSEDNIKLGLNDICENVDENKCIDFMKLIYRELSKENYSELYREISLMQKEKEGNKTSRIERKVDETRYGVKEANEKLDIIVNDKYNTAIVQNKVVKKENRTQEYVDKWNANMFLNNFDEWDEKAGVNVKLSDVYLDTHLPHFIYGNNKKRSTNLKKFLTRCLEKNSQNKMLLILGQPGIGKSTLITWITAHFTEKLENVLVYRFASDLKNIEWKSENITERILKELGLSNEDLNEKILILDGYDEISVKDDRKEIIDQLYWELVKNNTVKCFSLIVTCRVNYIKVVERVQCKYITLQPWDKEQIESFCKIFCRITNMSLDTEAIENIIKNKEILGVPLILYMVLALNISIDKEGSIVDVYDKIFSLEGGIYDRCIDNKSFADRHRVGKMKKQIHQLSREIAIWMFENNPNEAYIPAEEYKKICTRITQETEQKEKVIEQDFIIGNFFKLKHCEGGEGKELYFVHRSIYEYFFVEYIFSLLCEVIDSSKEYLASVLGKFLKGNILSRNMLEFLKIKILNSKLRDNFDIVNKSFQIMLQDGMTYYASKYYKEPYKNVMDCEMNVFKNMLEFIHLWNNSNMWFNSYIEKYIKSNYQLVLNLGNIDLTGANLKEAGLAGANLKGADLKGADLKGTNLKGTNLKGADLRKADLKGADLKGTNLKRTNLKGADLKGADLREAALKGADLEEADLVGADLREADLREANLVGADLVRADLKGADLMYAIFDEIQIIYLTNCNLSVSLVYVKESGQILHYLKYQKMIMK